MVVVLWWLNRKQRGEGELRETEERERKELCENRGVYGVVLEAVFRR